MRQTSGAASVVGINAFLEAVKQSGDLKMTPGKKLSDLQIAAIEKWIADGLPMPERMLKAKHNGADHWAFQPPKKAALPNVAQTDWIKTPLDRFILARLEAAKLKPSPEADHATLLRRVSLYLTGLPPTPEELSSFLNDAKADAYERQVDGGTRVR